jgi:hypothetical protein
MSHDEDLERQLRGLVEPTTPRVVPDLDAMRQDASRRRRGARATRTYLSVAAAAVVLLLAITAIARPGSSVLDTTDHGSPGTAPPGSTSIPAVIDPVNLLVLAAPSNAPDGTLDAARTILKGRLDRLEVVGASVDVVDQGLAVGFADATDRDRILGAAQIGAVQIRPVIATLGPSLTPVGPGLPGDPTLAVRQSASITDMDSARSLGYQLGPTDVDGTAIESATTTAPDVSGADGSWAVHPMFRVGSAGIDQFNVLARQCFEKAPSCPSGQLALTVDGLVVAAPALKVASFDRDHIEISGRFTEASARGLAAILGSEPLPIPLTPVESKPDGSMRAAMPLRRSTEMPSGQLEQEVHDALVGLSEAEAVTAARQAGWDVRVVTLEGVPQEIILNISNDRLNLDIEHGVVLTVTYG